MKAMVKNLNLPDAPEPTRAIKVNTKIPWASLTRTVPRKRREVEERKKREYKKPKGFRRYGDKIQKMWTPEEVKNVLELKASGKMDKEIGAIYGVTAEAVYQLRLRERRKKSRTVGESK